MKKYFLMSIVTILCLSFSGMAFAATGLVWIGDATGVNYGSTVFGGGTYKPSSKVTCGVWSTDGVTWCGSCQHAGAAGNMTAGKQFATKSDSPAIPWASPTTSAKPDGCSDGKTMPAITATGTGAVTSWQY